MVTQCGGGEHLGHEPIAEVDGDRLDIRGQRIHVAVLQHLLANQAEAFGERRQPMRIEQGLVDRRPVGPLELEGRTDPRSGRQPAARTEDVLGSLAETVLLHGGEIVSLARTAMPCPTGAAAVYRY